MHFNPKILGFIFLNVICCACNADDVPTTVRPLSLAEQLERDKIIPDLLEKPPAEAVRVNYSSGVMIHPGDEVSSFHVNEMPFIWWNGTETNFYTIMFVDIDYPSRVNPELRSFLVWLVVNIPGDSQSGGDILAPYIPPRPDVNTGIHRYVFLIYQQQEIIPMKEEFRSLQNERVRFTPAKFAKEFNLSTPIATNYFLLEFEHELPSNMLRMLSDKDKNLASNFANNIIQRSLCLAGFGIFIFFAM